MIRAMTVGELIEALHEQPDYLPVCMLQLSYEHEVYSGYANVTTVKRGLTEVELS